jgi:hypothetical protein
MMTSLFHLYTLKRIHQKCFSNYQKCFCIYWVNHVFLFIQLMWWIALTDLSMISWVALLRRASLMYYHSDTCCGFELPIFCCVFELIFMILVSNSLSFLPPSLPSNDFQITAYVLCCLHQTCWEVFPLGCFSNNLCETGICSLSVWDKSFFKTS